jgi:Na+/phosphate symporter
VTWTMLGSMLGGIGLFILGMRLMTDGFKYAAGRALRDILARSTRTPLRGILSGALITALVQASAMVTVATIGFVNAGLMSLRQALTIIYGTNIGTTMTGWMVAAVGLDFNIQAFALPAIGIGMFCGCFAAKIERVGWEKHWRVLVCFSVAWTFSREPLAPSAKTCNLARLRATVSGSWQPLSERAFY